MDPIHAKQQFEKLATRIGSNPRKTGGQAWQKRCGLTQRKARKMGVPKPPTIRRTNALLDAALRVWELKNGYS